jgi:hypothetical protein
MSGLKRSLVWLTLGGAVSALAGLVMHVGFLTGFGIGLALVCGVASFATMRRNGAGR